MGVLRLSGGHSFAVGDWGSFTAERWDTHFSRLDGIAYLAFDFLNWIFSVREEILFTIF